MSDDPPPCTCVERSSEDWNGHHEDACPYLRWKRGQVDLDDLERLAREASPGPWECVASWGGQSFVEPDTVIVDNDDEMVGNSSRGEGGAPVAHTFAMFTPGRDRANAAFIAAANPVVVSELVRRSRLSNRSSCPCLHVTPCHERCTCVNPVSSSGCRRCCTYGSAEQRAAMAKRLADFIDRGWARPEE